MIGGAVSERRGPVSARVVHLALLDPGASCHLSLSGDTCRRNRVGKTLSCPLPEDRLIAVWEQCSYPFSGMRD